MTLGDLAFGTITLFQSAAGILGNIWLLYHCFYIHFAGCKFKPTDLILKHLALANSLLILTKGVPQVVAVFGSNSSYSDFECKLVFYLYRVGRGVSFGATCLLSVFQAFTISSWKPRWMALKVKAYKYIDFFSLLCWILHMLINSIFPIRVVYKWNNKNITKETSVGYCLGISQGKIRDLLLEAIFYLPGCLSLGLMLWASSTMVVILYKHRQRVQHIHQTNLFPRPSLETRAIQRVLILVMSFVTFYALSSFFSIYVALTENPSQSLS
ncbi:vomeronasal type-1 receptor 4-like [Erinaceus europaeus]|uniref:Vomeronasal type-1 receptor n=1 Tax=Erinaceus europaeus TaxID=9365 RepID=A0A1S3WGI0_ERIEU|nr:vomeronasal type-1 receptor 4-like [Erinaceus europaeus]